MMNPYAQVDWGKVEFLHSFSHQHGRDPAIFRDMGFRHLPLSNYYPSQPFYPLPEAFATEHPEILGAPNAEQHGTTDIDFHFNALGSHYTTGYGKMPRINMEVAPIEYAFSDVNVFDAQNSPWLGVYWLDLRMARKPEADKSAAVAVTIQGASEVDPVTFAPVGDGVVRQRLFAEKAPEKLFLKTVSNSVRVRLDFDPASTRITQFRLMQGIGRPWRAAFRAALDGTSKNAEGRPIEGLLFPDGGGITINHPELAVESLVELLDFDPRVLGIEVWNMFFAVRRQGGFGETKDGPGRFYRRWDDVLRTGRRCFGFFVKDHVDCGQGRNVLLVPPSAGLAPEERERNALRAYRQGAFFGLLGAMATNEAGLPSMPYDYSQFRFTRITVEGDANGAARSVGVAIAGADPARRPVLQIRFVTEAGVAQRTDGQTHAVFDVPRDCRYVRIEAFACPLACRGEALTPARLGAMAVEQIVQLHDHLGPDNRPVPVADMIFSQPILCGPPSASRAAW